MRLPTTSTQPPRRGERHTEQRRTRVEHTGQPLTARSRTRSLAAALEELPPTLSIEEAAKLCGIGRNAAYRAAQRGELPSLRLGRRIRVPTARLLQMLGVDAHGHEAEPA